MMQYFKQFFLYFLILYTFVVVECVTEEDEGVKYANRCEGIKLDFTSTNYNTIDFQCVKS